MGTEPTASDERLPTFMIVGAMKSGTTSLAEYLRAHPDVFMTSTKEPRYFIDDGNYGRGIEWYRSLFADGASARARGEASTDYAKAPLWPETPARIAAVVPDVRLLYLLRDPVERVLSHYRLDVFRNLEQRPVNDAVLANSHYVDVSRYAYQLERFLEHFDRSQICVLWTDDLRDRQEETLARALTFIGVDPTVDRLSQRTLRREFHRSDRLRDQSSWNERIRRVAHWTPLRFLPSTRKIHMYKRFGRRFKVPDTTLLPEVEEELWSRLADDGERLEELVGEAPPWKERLR